MTTIGFIGSGSIGSTLARMAVDHGHDVVMSNSRGPETLSGLVAELGEHAWADTPEGAATAGAVVVVTIPLKSLASVPAEPLRGKVVIDTNNYYPQRDGSIESLEDESTTVSELLQQHLPQSRVVKGFNHLQAAVLRSRGRPEGDPERIALAIAGNDDSAKATVAELVKEFGYDVVDLGPLAEGWRIQRDTPGYIVQLDAQQLRDATAKAERYRDMA